MKKINKWKKWKIGAGSAAAVMVLFSIVQHSDAFRQQVLVSGTPTTTDTQGNLQQQDDRMQQWADSGADMEGYRWNTRPGHGSGRWHGSRGDDSSWTNRSGDSSDSGTSSDGGNWTSREYSSGSGMQSRTGRS
ncbi:hypothetical protein [Paenibacillus sp. SYP-B4298]|uniref:hypothetical protein n=1 Tax=Paenibacillus sp. SYP-B4298 TaxID=2996034 RepID=UPI0022DDAAE9|nr:hypothetical protein [Paenibacillus sp. SYP-B4298]